MPVAEQLAQEEEDDSDFVEEDLEEEEGEQDSVEGWDDDENVTRKRPGPARVSNDGDEDDLDESKDKVESLAESQESGLVRPAPRKQIALDSQASSQLSKKEQAQILKAQR